MNQTTNKNFSSHRTQELGVSLAKLFAGKALANSGAPVIPAVQIVQYDHNDKPSSCDILPLSAFAIN